MKRYAECFEMMAVPAEPRKPEIHSRRRSEGAVYSERWPSSLGMMLWEKKETMVSVDNLV